MKTDASPHSTSSHFLHGLCSLHAHAYTYTGMHAQRHTHVTIPENDSTFPTVHFACFTCCHGNNGGFARPRLAMDDKYITAVLALQVVRGQLQMSWKNIHLFDDWCECVQVIMSLSMCACMCVCMYVYVCV